ncbi:MAG: hypothetical protein CMF62_00315 [Magnetococcales bacterium]|nr:hypothetical protein [Magnetococcales bacterium]
MLMKNYYNWHIIDLGFQYRKKKSKSLHEILGDIIPTKILCLNPNSLIPIGKMYPELNDFKCQKYMFMDDLWGRNRDENFELYDLLFSPQLEETAKVYLGKYSSKHITILIGATVTDICFNKNPQKKISLTGNLRKEYYEGRYNAKLLADEIKDIEILQHPGYTINKIKKRNKIGLKYYEYLNNFIASITSCAIVRYNSRVIVSKIFEIPKTGSLLILDKNCESYMEEYGFKNKVNYLQYDSKESLKSIIEYVLDPNNLEEINKIRKEGYELVNNKYTLMQTGKLLDQIISLR